MIDFFLDNTAINADILLEGMFYSELPELLDYSVLKNNIMEVLYKMVDEEYAYFNYESGFIKDYKQIVPPSYIHGNGVETITYYAFKKNTALREMQIPNLLHYCSFIYNTLFVFEDIFTPLYLEPDNEEYVENSNSYVVIGDSFYIACGYDEEEELEEGVFTTDNNKLQSHATFGENRRRYDRQQGAYLYSVKMDIESFFPNMYTHYFEKIAEYEPYKSLGFHKEYFVFLDNFHQKINNNQTKGIPAGVFSSHIAAELCMLCVDYLIREEIEGKDIGYIRYVDDMTFFSDSRQELEQAVTTVQRILNKFRLRVNGNKTEYHSNVKYMENKANISLVYDSLPFLKGDEEYELDADAFQRFKIYMRKLLEKENIPQMKTVLTLFLRRVKEEKVQFIGEEYSWFCYIFMLAFENVNLICHVYKLLDMILEKVTVKQGYINTLDKKTEQINGLYKDTLFQIWHYYVLAKHMNGRQRAELMEKYFDVGGANPIIACWFVAAEDKKNQKLMKRVKEAFIEENGENGWQQRIMFSKWWLPILKVKMSDSHNYYRIMQSQNFPEILADLSIVDE